MINWKKSFLGDIYCQISITSMSGVYLIITIENRIDRFRIRSIVSTLCSIKYNNKFYLVYI